MPFGVTFKHSFGSINLDDDWWGTLLLLAFNVCDLAGRALPAFFILLSGKWLLLATVARVTFVVLSIACARAWPGFNDIAALVTMIALGVTNGYFASLSMMAGPQSVAAGDRQKAGFLMSFWLQAGILAGSQASFAFKPPQT